MKTPIDYFTDGYQAAEQGLPVTANPLLWKAWPYEAWGEGWGFFNIYSQLINIENEPLERIDKSPHEQGKIAAMKGIAMADCPYGEGTDRTAWQNGWLCAAEAEADLKLAAMVKTGLTYFAIVVVIGIAIYFAFQ